MAGTGPAGIPAHTEAPPAGAAAGLAEEPADAEGTAAEASAPAAAATVEAAAPEAGGGESGDSAAGLGTAAAEALGALSLPARLEAILYLKGRALSLAELAALAGLDPDATELALITLMADYAHRDTALEIHQEGNRYSLQLRDGLGDLVSTLLPVDLSTAALRTLATIALKRRILQSDLVELRGSGAYDHIKELLAQNFIERRRQCDGRSSWLTLSEKFHRTFAVQGLESRGPRPPAETLQLELDAVEGGDRDEAPIEKAA